MAGKVQTVLGDIPPSETGVTLSHEHLLCDASFQYKEPEEHSMGYSLVTIDKLEWLKRNQVNNLDNLRLLDVDTTITELRRFKDAGGDTVVDMGSIGLNRDPGGLARVSKATGVNIVMGSGFYVGASHPEIVEKSSVKELCDGIVRDITTGVGRTGIRAGVIGEVGCSYPLRETELKSLEATALAQVKTGAPVNIHPGQSQGSPMEIVERLHGFGGDIGRTAMSHVGNRHGMDTELTLELAETGCYIEYDSFGNYQNPIVLPEKTFYALSDWQRIQCIKVLIEQGFLDRILISHDIFNKTDLHSYGGFGYDHIHRTVIPLMHMKGLGDREIETMLVDNPSRFYSF